jgi:hypothetical protein
VYCILLYIVIHLYIACRTKVALSHFMYFAEKKNVENYRNYRQPRPFIHMTTVVYGILIYPFIEPIYAFARRNT